MRVLLDSNGYTQPMRGRERVSRIVRGAEQILLSTVVLGELPSARLATLPAPKCRTTHPTDPPPPHGAPPLLPQSHKFVIISALERSRPLILILIVAAHPIALESFPDGSSTYI